MFKKTLVITAATAMLSVALPAFAMSGSGSMMTHTSMTTGASATQVACVASAVGARETALDAGVTALTQAQVAAYSARATALQQAYTQTGGNSAIKSAIKAAWSAFTSAMKSARSTWQSARSSAWSTYRTAVKACKAPSVATDSANSSTEASGQ